MTFVLVVLFIFMLIVPVFGNKIVEMFRFANVDQTITDNISKAINILHGPITWFIIYFFNSI